MGKKGKSNKNNPIIQCIDLGSATLGYYPGSSDKTAVVTYGLANPALLRFVTSYSIEWQVKPVGGDRFYTASTSSSSGDSATFDIPTNAVLVRALVKVSGVIEDGGKGGKKNKKQIKNQAGSTVIQTNEIEGKNTTKVTTPPTPTLTITNKTKGTIRIDNYNDTSPAHTTRVIVQLMQRSGTTTKQVGGLITLNTNAGHAMTTFTATIGYYYKARAYAVGDSSLHTIDSDWSSFCGEVNTIPPAVAKAPILKAEPNRDDSWPVYVSWDGVANAEKYKIEYTTNQAHFGSDSDDVYSVETSGPTANRYVTSNITGGRRWYFRVRAVNSVGEGDPSPVNSIIIGSKPAAPTTWSYETVLKIGEPAVLCWTHNSTDGSFMESAQIYWKIGSGGTYHTVTVTVKADDGSTQTQDTDPTKVVTTYKYSLPTNTFADGNIIYWKVRTKGAIDGYGDFSTERQITVYEPPTLSLAITDTDGVNTSANEITGSTSYNDYSVVTSFPLVIQSTSGPQTQTPIGLSYEIIAEEGYSILVEDGSEIYVAEGEIVYKRYATVTQHNVTLTLNPGDIFLNNNTRYSLKAVVAMSNGLTAEATVKFLTHWELSNAGLSAYINVDVDNLVAYVRPYVYDNATFAPITEGYYLSVYRREVNATFDLIAERLDSSDGITIVDVHPALDYARYRIVGINKNNGTVSFYDMPGVEVGETGIAIHWNENWRAVDEGNLDYGFVLESNENYQFGSLLILPYNVDVNDDMGKEASLINYAGRVYPVSYYGTQRSLTSKWTVQVPKDDKETLNSIRRLAMYGGDSYVREPNGTGYWAALTLSYTISHNNPIVSVNFNITRVEGGDKGLVSESDQTLWTETVEEEEG